MQDSSAEKAIFQAALFLSGKGEREEFLDVACQENRDLRQRVELLLKMAESGGSFMRQPAIHAIDEDTRSGDSLRETPPVDLSGISIATATDSLTGQTLGPYRVVSLIGAGGMGEVYAARDTRLGREVALKILPKRLASDPGRRARFDREVRAVAALSHPNILAIHDCGTHGSVAYAVMERLEGQTLKGRLANGPLPWREAVEVGAAVAEGLAAAHAKGIVHRDLKPDNLFLTADGRVKIVDFGLARLDPRCDAESDTASLVTGATEPGTLMGTVGYMSPEQVRGQPADATSDIFSLGCVLYEMVSGLRAFRRYTAAETMAAILHDEPPEPNVSGNRTPAELKRLIRQCLAKNPHQRLQSARDLALGLRATASDPNLQRPAAARGTSRVFAGIAAAVLLIGAIGALLSLLRTPSDKNLPVESLAVLPFENLTGDPNMDYLGVSLADQLIDSLSRVRRQNLQVRPFTSVHRIEQQVAPRNLGRDLNVQAIVAGRLYREANDLSLQIEVVDTRNEDRLGGKAYSGNVSEIIDWKNRIAKGVAGDLRLNLTADEERRLTKAYTQNQEAYRLYNAAIYEHNKFTRDGLARAINLCEKALEKDRDFVLAHVGIARCYILLGTMHLGPRQTFDQAKEAVGKALALGDSSPEVHAVLGAVHLWLDWDWEAAESELRQALAPEGRFPRHNLYGFYHAARGNLNDALDELKRGQELEDGTAARSFEVAMCYNWMGHYRAAIDEARRAVSEDEYFFPAYGQLGLALALTGEYDDAIKQLHTGLERGNRQPHLRGLLGYAYAVARRREDAKQLLRELKADAEQNRFGCALALARIHAALGDKEQAIEWLKKACDERDPQVIWLKVDPTFADLRGDEQFTLLLERMGLPPDQPKRTVVKRHGRPTFPTSPGRRAPATTARGRVGF